MYSLYPNIISKIRKKVKKLGLTSLLDSPESLIVEKKRFYRTICETKTGKKAFFKSLLAKEKGVKDRFSNEINFLKVLGENPSHPLSKFCPKILDYSLSNSFPCLLYEFLPGKSKLSGKRFSKEEIKKVAGLLKTISSSKIGILNFISKKSYFPFALYKKNVENLLKKLSVFSPLTEEKIRNFLHTNQKIFRNIQTGLSHGDFSEANLIFHKRELKIIDWEHISLRNPLYDLADFWMKRRNQKEEQKVLLKEYFKNTKGKETLMKLFKIAILEICLRDLLLFNKILESVKKEKKSKVKKAVKKEINEYLKIIKKEIL